MAEYPHLRNAPITEAIVDVRTMVLPDFNAEQFAQLVPILAKDFPLVERMHGETFSTPHGPPSDAKRMERSGYLFRSADRLTIAQFRRDGFTLNRLHPYLSWRELRPIAVALWARYRQIVGPLICARIGLRYVNLIDVVVPNARLEDYFLVYPTVPRDKQRHLTEFFSRSTVLDPETGLMAAITMASQPSASPNVGLILLDIDTYRQAAAGFSEEVVAPTLDALRIFKNDLFFNSITPKTVDRYR
ncbi:MAG TPA: TIGR04255 family protein [Gemmatimonadaceae bacterium]|nr:TIGR04255 family protein [Gemmatimonadaceae bacterium]